MPPSMINTNVYENQLIDRILNKYTEIIHVNTTISETRVKGCSLIINKSLIKEISITTQDLF